MRPEATLMKRSAYLLFASACLIFGPSAHADSTFPSRPVKIIVPYPPGGGSDILARSLATSFTKATGQPMVVENRTGASGMVGAAACKNAPADGYTYCLPNSDVMTINPHVFKTVPYDPEKDFTAVAPVATMVLAVIVNSDVAVNSLKDLASWSQANKAKANFATWGVGTAAHLVMAQMNKDLNGSLTAVPYAGLPTMLQATLNNEASGTLLFYGPISAHIASGKLKPLAVMAEKRFPALPNVPTVKEAGFDFAPTVYFGVFGPKGIPASVAARMSELVKGAVADPEVLKIMSAQGFTPMAESPTAFAQRVSRDRATWAPIVKSLNVQLD